jgi:hypothetical protein
MSQLTNPLTIFTLQTSHVDDWDTFGEWMAEMSHTSYFKDKDLETKETFMDYYHMKQR